jgi:hypothetical protein
MRGMGTVLRWWDPGEFRSLDHVEDQFLSNWSVDIDNRIHLNQAQGEAQKKTQQRIVFFIGFIADSTVGVRFGVAGAFSPATSTQYDIVMSNVRKYHAAPAGEPLFRPRVGKKTAACRRTAGGDGGQSLRPARMGMGTSIAATGPAVRQNRFGRRGNCPVSAYLGGWKSGKTIGVRLGG